MRYAGKYVQENLAVKLDITQLLHVIKVSNSTVELNYWKIQLCSLLNSRYNVWTENRY